MFEGQGDGPFVRRGFEIPLRGRQVFGVGDDGVAGLFEIYYTFLAIGLGKRLRENGWRKDNGGAEQQDCFSHGWFSSRFFSGEMIVCEITFARK